MLYEFLNYLQPVHYFMLKRHEGGFIFPKPEALPKAILNQLIVDKGYSNKAAINYDLAWQALQKGYLGNVKTIDLMVTVPLKDKYHFIRKYFHKAWVFYVLLVRLIGLKNPFKELRAWYATRQVKRSSYLESPIPYLNWNGFQSALLDSKPKVSIIIPTLNRYEYLKDVLTDLEQQDYPHFEVIIVDQSEPYQASFYANFQLELKVIKQQEKALWLARNTAIKMSKSDYLLFFDDDSRVAPDWIRMHLKAMDFFNADVSSGVSISKVGGTVPAHYTFFKISDQLDTGNVLIKKEVFKRVGLFDRQFEKQRMGDGEFGLRVFLNGFFNISNPYAKRLHLKVGSGGLRDMGSWDAFRTKTWNAPRPIPSVLYFFRRYFGSLRAKYALLRLVPLSIMPYRFKKNKPLLVLGAIVSVFMLPLIGFQVMKSWRLSSKKLKQGPLIDTME